MAEVATGLAVIVETTASSDYLVEAAVAVAMPEYVEHSLTDWILVRLRFLSEYCLLVHIAGAELVHAADFAVVCVASSVVVAVVAELCTSVVALLLQVAAGYSLAVVAVPWPAAAVPIGLRSALAALLGSVVMTE